MYGGGLFEVKMGFWLEDVFYSITVEWTFVRKMHIHFHD